MINQHTAGPLAVGMRGGANANGIYARNGGDDKEAKYRDASVACVYEMPLNTNLETVKSLPRYAEGLATARLLAASYTAFDKAGRELGIDAAELAEKIDLAALIRAAYDLTVNAEKDTNERGQSVVRDARINALALPLIPVGVSLVADAGRRRT